MLSKSKSTQQDNRLIGYARVSTDEQDLSMQVEALRKAGVRDVNLYTDKRSGRTMRRPGLDAALLDCRPGDVLIVWKLDRLARSVEDLIALSKRLSGEGVELRSIHDQIDTTTPIGMLFFHLMAALAQFEASLIGFRTKRGMEAARERGAKFGPKPKFGARDLQKAIRLLERGKSAAEVGRHFGVTGQLVRQKVLASVGRPLWTPKRKRKN